MDQVFRALITGVVMSLSAVQRAAASAAMR